MSIPKKKFREMVFQLLYSHDLSASEVDDLAPMMMEQLNVSRTSLRAATARMQEIMERKLELDGLITEHATDYELDRIPRVERSILRLGIFEILHDSSLPPPVAITEAMRLAKKFSTPESLKFVNGVLDSVYKASDLCEVEEEEEDKMDTFFGKKDED